jgi:phosphatidylglycerol lysyltransferase
MDRFFSYHNVNYSSQLWWRFELESNAPRFLRAQVGILIFVSVIAMKQLFRYAKVKEVIERVDQSRVEKIVSLESRSDASLALLGDKKFYFSNSGNSMIMYGIHGKSWISMGDPLGVEEEWSGLLWDFRELADQSGGNAIFYQVSPSHIVNYVDMGLALVKLGEIGKVLLDDFNLEGSSHKQFRWTLKKAEKEGLSFRVLMPPETKSVMGRLEEISNFWLADKNTREKGFSLGFFSREYVGRFPVGVVELDSSIVAFANLWLSYEKEEISPDLIRYTSDIPREVMDYLLLKTMFWGKEQGFRYFNLGISPLSGFEEHKMAPIWQKFGNFLYRHGEYFYNFQGLRMYKDKFSPTWEPRYLAFPGKLSLPGTLADVSALIAGGITGIFRK